MIDKNRVRQQFADYTSAYDDSDEKIKLKIDHTYRVAELCERLAVSEGFGERETELAWLLGMLHDVGRFEQLRRYGTFVDADSIDHAEFGAYILFGKAERWRVSGDKDEKAEDRNGEAGDKDEKAEDRNEEAGDREEKAVDRNREVGDKDEEAEAKNYGKIAKDKYEEAEPRAKERALAQVEKSRQSVSEVEKQGGEQIFGEVGAYSKSLLIEGEGKTGSIRDYLEDSSEDELIETAIRFHSAYRVPEDLDVRTKRFCNILRDADKIDILKVNVDVPLESIYNVTPEELRQCEVSEAVMREYRKEHAILRSLKRTPADNIVGHIALVYELVFPESIRIVQKQGYLERLFDYPTQNPQTKAQFVNIRRQMEDYIGRKYRAQI